MTTLTILNKNCAVLVKDFHTQFLFSYGKLVAARIKGKDYRIDGSMTTNTHISKFLGKTKKQAAKEDFVTMDFLESYFNSGIFEIL